MDYTLHFRVDKNIGHYVTGLVKIQAVEHTGEHPYLLHTEDISKNNQGGLKGQKVTPKYVRHYVNEQEPPDALFIFLSCITAFVQQTDQMVLST